MRFITSFYRTEKGKTTLILQQTQRKDGMPVVFAAVSDGGNREEFAVSLIDWFYSAALPVCRRGNAAKCADRVEKLLAGELAETEHTAAFSVLFAMGGECVIAWQKDADIRFFQQCFDKNMGQTLTWYAEELTYRRLFVQAGVGILLGNGEYFAHIDGQSLNMCLPGRGLEQVRQADRHLAETAQEAERRGAKDVAAVLLVTVE